MPTLGRTNDATQNKTLMMIKFFVTTGTEDIKPEDEWKLLIFFEGNGLKISHKKEYFMGKSTKKQAY